MHVLPRRRQNLVVQEVQGGEALVLDPARSEVHHLAPPAAAVFAAAQGQRSYQDVGSSLGMTEDAVLTISDGLVDLGLLERVGATRRSVLLAAGAAPLVLTMLVPAAAQAASGTDYVAGGSSSKTAVPPGTIDFDQRIAGTDEGYYIGGPTNQAVGEIATVRRAGMLTGVSVGVYKFTDGAPPLVVSIQEVLPNGTPGAVYRTASASQVLIAGNVVYVTFSKPLKVQVNRRLFVTLRSAAPSNDGWALKSTGQAVTGAYSQDGGQTWDVDTLYATYFATYVQ